MFSRKGIILAIVACLACGASAQFFRFNNRSFGMGDGGITRAEIKLDPSAAVTGQRCAFVLEFEVPKNNLVEGLQVSGLPQVDGGAIEYLSDAFENLADGATTNKNNVVKRFRLPLMFHKPYAGELRVTVSGNVGTRTQRAGMSMSSFSGFTKRLPPLAIDVRPLPDEGKPEGFFGAVGKSFAIKATLSPSKVHPGDLVTASYEVTYDGYFPTNAIPMISGLSEKDFTLYDLKTQGVGEGVAKWTQVLVPKSASATNSFTVTVPYYDLERKVYDTVVTKVAPLEFVSKSAASTENTSVIVSDSKEEKEAKVTSGEVASLTLRFAPSENSPVIATVPSTTPVKEVGRYGKWIRISTPDAIGWITADTLR